jgi:hypothetical protein
VMSVTTRLLPWEVTSATGGDHHSFPGGQPVYQAYSNALNLRSIHFGEDMKAAENQASSPQTRARAPTPPPRCLLRLFLCVRRTSFRKASSHQTRTHAPTPPPRCLLRLFLCVRRLNQQRHVLHRCGPRPQTPFAASVRSPPRCCAGPHRQYDPFTKSFLNLVPGQGQYAVPRSNPTPPLASHHPRSFCAASAPTPSRATRAGVVGRASASRRPATRATPALKPAHAPCHATIKTLTQFSAPPRMVGMELAQCVGTSNQPQSPPSLTPPLAHSTGTPRWSTRRARKCARKTQQRRAARSRGPAHPSRRWRHHSIGESVCPCASAWGMCAFYKRLYQKLANVFGRKRIEFLAVA